MASNNLKSPVVINARRIDATLLPRGFSIPYQLYVIQQSTDIENVAAKANDAGEGAYDSLAKNNEQDVKLAFQAQELSDHDTRISNAEEALVYQQTEIVSLEGDVNYLLGVVVDIDDAYVSKTETAEQSIASPLNAVGHYSVNGVQVIGLRQTGWIAATGTASRGAFNADATYVAGTVYSQAEFQALSTALTETRQRLKALEDVLRSHGLTD